MSSRTGNTGSETKDRAEDRMKKRLPLIRSGSRVLTEKRKLSQQFFYPFTAPSMIPLTKYFWIKG